MATIKLRTFTEVWPLLSADRKILFRLLQRAYRDVNKNKQMFSFSTVEYEIREYVIKEFGLDLANLDLSNIKEESSNG